MFIPTSTDPSPWDRVASHHKHLLVYLILPQYWEVATSPIEARAYSKQQSLRNVLIRALSLNIALIEVAVESEFGAVSGGACPGRRHWRKSFNRGGCSVSAGATRLVGVSDAVSTRVIFERVHSLVSWTCESIESLNVVCVHTLNDFRGG
jgi:hypothetical protein